MLPRLPLLLAGVLCAAAQERPGLPSPDHAEVKYGPHERNVLDLWLAKTPGRHPLVIFYHGGGFRAGDKRSISAGLLEKLLAGGISVAAANYRLTNTAPYPAPMLDSARALQFLRLHAKRYGLDGKRAGAFGSSAGSGISQWLAYHDDLADKNNSDPVLRQSTRLSAVAPYNAQSSYDPRFIAKLMESDKIHPALIPFFGMSSAADVTNPKFFPLFEDSSPINHLSAGDPPILVFFGQRNDPLPANSTGEQHIHHPKFGFVLKEKADRLGIPCTVLLREDFPAGFPADRFAEFFRKYLGRP